MTTVVRDNCVGIAYEESVKSEITRLAILRAAEGLFAARGVDTVSLREVAAAAKQRNHSAVLYHFGDKRELLEALLHRHSGRIDDAFPARLSELQASGNETIEALCQLLVQPLAAKLDDEDGGPSYLQVCAELTVSRSFPLTSFKAANGPGATAVAGRLHGLIRDQSPALVPLRMLRVAGVLFGSLAAYHRIVQDGFDVPRDLFERDLVASLHALLAAG